MGTPHLQAYRDFRGVPGSGPVLNQTVQRCEPCFAGEAISMAPSVGGSEGKVVIVASIEIHLERLEELLEVIAATREWSLTEEGCLRYDVLRVQQTENKFVLYEVYASAEAVELHRCSPYSQAYRDFRCTPGKEGPLINH